MDLSPDEDQFPGRLLHQAALWDNAELLADLLAGGGVSADATDARGRTALHAAAVAERSRCLAPLLEHGARVDAQSDRTSGAKTALHVAAERGHCENLKLLLAAKADLNIQDGAGHTALELAERTGHRHAASLLRDARDALERARLSQHRQLRELVTRGESNKLRLALSRLAGEAGLLVNLAPGGASTLLYAAAESGCADAAVALLSAGADGRAHSVTRYSPLYAAAYQGHAEIVRILLHYFPELAQQETVERWLPLHAACIGGHAAVLKMLLEFPYPAHVLNTYTDEGGKWKYEAAFDVNARDVSGQSALYVACTLGNLPLVDALLDHTALCISDGEGEEEGAATPTPLPPPAPAGAGAALSPTRGRISHGIHSIVCRLTGQTSTDTESRAGGGRRARPVRLEVGCPGDTCLGAAVRRGHLKVVERLLAAGADPNAPCRDTDDVGGSQESRRASRQQRPRSTSALPRRSSPSPSPCRRAHPASAAPTDPHSGAGGEGCGALTPLGVAARARQHRLAELLLAHGATDPHCVALREAASQSDELMLARLLATKAYADPEYKVNRSVVAECVFASERAADAELTYSAMSPGTPVALDWRELHAQLNKIRLRWLVEAALHVNPRLSDAGAALHALTRVDLSGNELRELPATLFTLASLRYLNAAQNKLERLPTAPDLDEQDSLERRARRRRVARAPHMYSAPVLEELYLQDNRLEELPPALFSLPALVSLDVSNNKLRALPPAVWRAPRLRDLSAALNHLRDLPLAPPPPPPDRCSEPRSPTTTADCASPSCSPRIGVTGSTSAGHISQFFFGQKSASRSASVEQVSAAAEEVAPAPAPAPRILNRAGNATCGEARRVHVWRRALEVCAESAAPAPAAGGARAHSLASLNLAHNQFTAVPAALACLAPALTRLNMAYNALRSMSYVTSYPTTLRQLDLSHNEITCWPSLPQMESLGSADAAALACYCAGAGGAAAAGAAGARPRSGGSVRAQLLNSVCPARRHLRLESLRTLILANNLLTRIQLTTDDDGALPLPLPALSADDDDDDWSVLPSVKTRLLFPNLSMLDVSCNLLRAVPAHIHDLANLSVLNIGGNKDITELPPQMGLLSRLWNLNTAGCPLQEPLRTMLASPKYKSMDVIGYLKSVLEEAQPYARMKLMLVGAQGRGKTSLLDALRHESNILHRRKPTEHWAKRMGNKTASLPGKNISTVGVDIGTWVYEKHRAPTGPVTFRTWDFGGQHEYYATHQYFLSRRSLYLVVWKVTEGRRGLAGVLKWLRSIQARAPGSPAIIVATHYDTALNSALPDGETPESLQRLIRTHIMGAADADKLGLPRVWDSVEVSCTTRHNMRLLADIVYTCAFSVKPPGSKEPLLEQRVPATYLALEECVATLAADLRARGAEPVLRHEQYKQQVTQLMQHKFHRSFRDAAELHQATMFLHENGVMLHYDDATLKELYFLEPQWLCDMLAHVVTVREINPFARNGIMKLEELQHVFKSSPLACRSEETRALVLSLLNKFELALGWDGRSLLVPPLLPAHPGAPVILSLRARHWAGSARGTPQHRAWAPPLSLPPAAAAFAAEQSGTGSGTQSPTLVGEEGGGGGCTVWGRGGCERALRRLLLLSYVPCGFWPRLITRVLADEAVADVPHQYYKLPAEVCVDAATARALEMPATWQLWQSGLRLMLGELALLVVREVPTTHAEDLFGATAPLLDADWEPSPPGAARDDYRSYRFRLKQDGAWCELDAAASSIVEILLPAEVLVVRRAHRDDAPHSPGYQSVSVEPSPESVARLLSLASDHVDLLLEDWYPTLGTRFVHTSEGRCLITRISPCGMCLRDPQPPPPHADVPRQLHSVLKRLEVQPAEPPVRVSTDSRASDGDSGVGAESTASSRMGSVEGALAAGGGGGGAGAEDARPLVYSWSVEECILTACGGVGGAALHRTLACPVHGERALATVAPDTMMLDVEESRVARWEEVTRGALLGRGAFGLVFRAEWRRPGCAPESVALKVLQPVPPGAGARLSARHAYKAAVSRWAREPAAAACRAYCGARQELAVLAPLRHPHVVPLRAVCTAPLALLLHLAPMGALDTLLRQYRGCGARVGARAARALALQVARALEYLHARRIVYRDLKAENVLVWSAPQPQEAPAAELASAPINVLVKLGDYGISRLTLPSGTKGFGGTEGFMAPEIMRYNGEEEYTEKVDCFSFGMFLYEVLTLRQPFEGHEAVKEAILEGARPALAPRDTSYPCYMLDLMCCCWAGQPEPRPSASSLVSLCAAPEYSALQDVAAPHAQDAAALTSAALPAAAAAIAGAPEEEGGGGWEVWWGAGSRLHTLVATPTAFTHHYTLKLPQDGGSAEEAQVSALCWVGQDMWVGDTAGRVTVYSISTCAVRWRCRVEESVGGGCARAGVAAILSLAPLPRLAVAMDNGRLFLVRSERGAAPGAEAEAEAEAGFVLTELGAASALACLAAVPRGDAWEVWCGGEGLWCYEVGAGGVAAAHALELAPPAVALLAADAAHVFSYSTPGCVVLQWCARRREATARLDCSKLVPCSESLNSIAIEEHLSPTRCQVVSLCVLEGCVYAGTAWGCIVVAEAHSLRPVTVFRPYEQHVVALVPLRGCAGAGAMLASLGAGYRSLLARYTDLPAQTGGTPGGAHCLLWRAHHWTND